MGQTLSDYRVEPEFLLQHVGLKLDQHYRKKDGRLFVQTCFFCSNSADSLEIDCVSGAWHCKACKNSGNYILLKTFFCEEFGFSELMPSPSQSSVFSKNTSTPPPSLSLAEYETAYLKHTDDIVTNWLASKKISQESIKKFLLGTHQSEGRYYVSIPYINNNNKITCIKYRLASDEKGIYRSYIDSKFSNQCLYNYNNLSSDSKEVYIVKNEIDCWVLRELGYLNVIALPTTKTNVIKYLDPLKDRTCKIVLLFKSNYINKELALEITGFLGKERTYNIKLPKDLLSIYIDNSPEDVKNILHDLISSSENSLTIDVIDIRTAFVERILDLGQVKEGINLAEGITSPWASLNAVLPVFKWGNTVVVGGYSGGGKTTFAYQWIKWLAEEHNIPCFNFNVEMSKTEMVDKYTEMTLGKTQKQKIAYPLTILGDMGDKESYVPLWITRNVQERTEQDILNIIEATVLKHNIKVVVFDNFHIVQLERKNKSESTAYLYNQFSKNLRFLASKLNIILMIIAQPPKTDESNIPTKYMLRETDALQNDASQILMVHRRRKEDWDASDILSPVSSLSNYTLICIEKARMEGVEAKVLLKYYNGKLVDPAMEDLEEVEEEKRKLFKKKLRYR